MKAPPIRPLAKTLKVLNLRVNNITSMYSEYFSGFDLLESIDLSQNRLISLPNMHHVNGTLKSLFIQRNNLEQITPLYFVPLGKLRLLHLSHNYLVNISFEHTMWPALLFLQLTHNLLSTINPYRPLTHGITTIRMQGNPWHCDRKLCWLAACSVKKKYGHAKFGHFICSRNHRTVYNLFGVCYSPGVRKEMEISESGKRYGTEYL